MVFKRNDTAAVIDVAALNNSLGTIPRLAIRSIRAARKVWFAENSYRWYSAHSELVKNRLLELAATDKSL
jgi:hypothetical protein